MKLDAQAIAKAIGKAFRFPVTVTITTGYDQLAKQEQVLVALHGWLEVGHTETHKTYSRFTAQEVVEYGYSQPLSELAARLKTACSALDTKLGASGAVPSVPGLPDPSTSKASSYRVCVNPPVNGHPDPGDTWWEEPQVVAVRPLPVSTLDPAIHLHDLP